MTENEALKIFENEVIILDCLIENDKDIIANCDTEDDEFDDDKELAELSLKDYSERKELFETAISALKEIQQYREIGTVGECREAVEKQKVKEIVCENDSVFSNGFSHYRMGKCPMCDRYYNSSDEVNYCSKCGQALMNENLEGMEE